MEHLILFFLQLQCLVLQESLHQQEMRTKLAVVDQITAWQMVISLQTLEMIRVLAKAGATFARSRV